MLREFLKVILFFVLFTITGSKDEFHRMKHNHSVGVKIGSVLLYLKNLIDYFLHAFENKIKSYYLNLKIMSIFYDNNAFAPTTFVIILHIKKKTKH